MARLAREACRLALLISVLAILADSQIPIVRAQASATAIPTIELRLERATYAIGDRVTLDGWIFNSSQTPAAIQSPDMPDVNVRITANLSTGGSGAETVYKEQVYAASTITQSNGEFITDSFVLPAIAQGHLVKIEASAQVNVAGMSRNISAFVIFEPESTQQQYLGYATAFAVAPFFVYFLYYIAQPRYKLVKANRRIMTVVLFALFASFVISATLVFLAVGGFGEDLPLGVVYGSFGNETQWIINMGGARQFMSDTYTGGLQVPVYVVLLSLYGSFAYFLARLPSSFSSADDPKSKIDDPRFLSINLENLSAKIKQGEQLTDDEATLVRSRIKMAREAVGIAARFFMSPFLAIALFYILWAGGLHNDMTLGALMVGAGLSTDLVYKSVEGFLAGRIPDSSPKAPSPS